MNTARRGLFLLDGSSYFFRAYHAGVRLSRSDGFPTAAVFVFTRMLLRLLKDEQPSHLFAVFDTKGGTFRRDIYPAYKANRPPMPEDLARQFEPTMEVLRALRVPVVARPGFEADDLIATLARQGREQGFEVVVVSGDKDLAQLVAEGVVMLDTLKGARYDREGVREKWGIWPNQMRDFLALKGDSSDNVPGVPGIGDKKARQILMDFGDVDNLKARLQELRNPKLKATLEEHWDQLVLSRRLVTLVEDVPLDVGPADGAVSGPDPQAMREVLARYEFLSLAEEFDLALGAGSLPAPAPGTQGDLFAAAPAAAEPAAEPKAAPVYHTLDTLPALDAVLDEARAVGAISLDTETDSLDPLVARLVGLALSVRAGQGWYVPLGHRQAERQLTWDEVRPRLQALLDQPGMLVVGHNLKFDGAILAAHGVTLPARQADTMIASYLLNPDKQRHGMDECARRHLGRTTLPFSEVAPDAMFDAVDVATATRYSGEDAEVTRHLADVLLPRLEEAGLGEVFTGIEMPLVGILSRMELLGIRVEAARLTSLAHGVRTDLQRLEREIYEAAGQAFTIHSPKQLGEVLFGRLGLPVVKKGKSGPSTDVTVLEELSDRHPLPAKVLEYRHLAKLLNTYLEVLPTLVHPRTGRIHTSYNQTVTATGRLSSSDPNLQNIPVRTELGRRIRDAFVPAEGMVFVGADYSQIELRVLAHLSKDPGLIEAFRAGQDIHTRTAAELFGVAPAEVTRELRGRAKTINFGVLYGMSAFRLAREFNVPRGEAQAFIEHYFARYPGIRAYMDRTLEEGRRTGFVRTLFGRRRPLPDLLAGQRSVAQAAERVAINTPVQGSAADIIKLAMIAVDAALRARNSQARLVLQVHDELLIEAPEAEADAIRELVRARMEGVTTLAVPLTVDSGVGRTWNEAHG